MFGEEKAQCNLRDAGLIELLLLVSQSLSYLDAGALTDNLSWDSERPLNDCGGVDGNL